MDEPWTFRSVRTEMVIAEKKPRKTFPGKKKAFLGWLCVGKIGFFYG